MQAQPLADVPKPADVNTKPPQGEPAKADAKAPPGVAPAGGEGKAPNDER